VHHELVHGRSQELQDRISGTEKVKIVKKERDLLSSPVSC
jgi:hypothetical protein